MYEEQYDQSDAIPDAVKHLYKEQDGKFLIIGPAEIKTNDDVLRVQEALRKEREDHKKAKKQLVQFKDLDPDDVYAKLDRIKELEAAADGKIDEGKISEMVETRIKTKTAPLERQISSLTSERDDALIAVREFEAEDMRRKIHDQIRKAAAAANIRDTAMDDATIIGEKIFDVDEDGRVLTKDGVGVTPGVEPSVWFTEIKANRPHWWAESQGAGARGSDGRMSSGNNPFTAESWNLTEQGKILTADRTKAEQLAKAAGTTIGGGKPKK